MGFAYVLRIGEGRDLYKVGKARDHEERRKTLSTGSADRLTEFALIESERYAKVEEYIKDHLQARRWRGGEGTEIYQVPEDELLRVLDGARDYDANVLPGIAEVTRLAKEPCDRGLVITPGEAQWEIYQEVLRLKEIELVAKYKRERIEMELKRLMGTASAMDGIATWRSETKRIFNAARFRLDHRDLHEQYKDPTHSRPFRIRW
jgi:hypothetical protein